MRAQTGQAREVLAREKQLFLGRECRNGGGEKWIFSGGVEEGRGQTPP